MIIKWQTGLFMSIINKILPIRAFVKFLRELFTNKHKIHACLFVFYCKSEQEKTMLWYDSEKNDKKYSCCFLFFHVLIKSRAHSCVTSLTFGFTHSLLCLTQKMLCTTKMRPLHFRYWLWNIRCCLIKIKAVFQNFEKNQLLVMT